MMLSSSLSTLGPALLSALLPAHPSLPTSPSECGYLNAPMHMRVTICKRITPPTRASVPVTRSSGVAGRRPSDPATYPHCSVLLWRSSDPLAPYLLNFTLPNFTLPNFTLPNFTLRTYMPCLCSCWWPWNAASLYLWCPPVRV